MITTPTEKDRARAIEVLREIRDNSKASPADRLRAVEILHEIDRHQRTWEGH
jgi:hypothetical protein